MKSLVLLFTFLFSSLALAEVQIEIDQSKAIDYHYYNFGSVNVNMRVPARYKITNTGKTPLVFQRATISGQFFDAYHTCRKGIEVNQSCFFTIEYWPMFEGTHYGRFDITFDQGTEIVVDVAGRAVKY